MRPDGVHAERASAFPRIGSFPASRDRQQLPAGQKKFAGLRHDQFFARELMLELKRAAGREHAERVVQVEPHGDIARRAANINRRRNDARREDPQLRSGGKFDADAPEIQRDRDGSARLQHREFRRTANINLRRPRSASSAPGPSEPLSTPPFATNMLGAGVRDADACGRPAIHGNSLPSTRPTARRRRVLRARRALHNPGKAKHQAARPRCSADSWNVRAERSIWTRENMDTAYTIQQ